MRRLRWLAPALLVLALATGWTFPPQERGTTVVGQVTNGTPGAAVPAGLPVTLHVSGALGEATVYTTTLAADGSFRFEGLSPTEGSVLLVRLRYQGVLYASDAAAFEADQRQLNLEATVYETTEDASAVSVTRLHLFMVPAGDRLRVAEFHQVSNVGERTYVGAQDPETGRRVTIDFSLPAGASAARFDEAEPGERFVLRQGGFSDTEPVLPGEGTVEVLFSYDLPNRDGLELERTFGTRVGSAVLLAAEGMALEGDQLTPAGAVTTQMGPALSYAAGPLEPGEPLVCAVVGGSEAPPDDIPVRSAGAEVALGLAAVAAATVAALLLLRSPGPGSLAADARPVVEEIAALDVEFEAGRLSREAYVARRRRLRHQLHDLLGCEAPGEDVKLPRRPGERGEP